MSLADEFAADADDLIQEFGEPVEFRRYVGGVVACKAVVKRQGPEAGPIGPSDARPVVDVIFSTNPLTGVDPATIDFKRDGIGVSRHFGGDLEDFRLGSAHALIKRSPGRFTLRVR